jgi:NTP pyrophosphatase (non-canonical NTP hydrolase)
MTNLQTYAAEALRTAGPLTTQRDRLLCSALGLAGESAEVVSVTSCGRRISSARAQTREELGDVLWYVALLCVAVDEPLAWEKIDEDLLASDVCFSAERLPTMAGRIADVVKKYAFQGHDLDRNRTVAALVEILYHLAILAHAVGSSLDEVAAVNLAKLRARYPDGFDPERSINRPEVTNG